MASTQTDYAHCRCGYPATPACRCVRPGWHIEASSTGMDLRCPGGVCDDLLLHVEDVKETE